MYCSWLFHFIELDTIKSWLRMSLTTMWPCLQDRQVQKLETKYYVEIKSHSLKIFRENWFPQMCDTSEYTSVETDGFSAT